MKNEKVPDVESGKGGYEKPALTSYGPLEQRTLGSPPAPTPAPTLPPIPE